MYEGVYQTPIRTGWTHPNLPMEFRKRRIRVPQMIESTESRTKYRAWMVRYRWHGMSNRYLSFKPRYNGENSRRRRQQVACEERRIDHDKQLGRSRRWEGGADQCERRMSDSQTLMSDLHGDLEGLFRKTIRTIVEDRSQAFAKVMRTQIKEGGDKVTESVQEPHTSESHTNYQSQLAREARQKRHEEGKSKGVKVSGEPSVEKVIKRSQWMVTWSRLETASPFPELETYIKKEGEWFEPIARDLERTPSDRKYGHDQRGQKLLISNRVNWSAATVRKKIHLEGNEAVTIARVMVYVEFDFSVAQSDMQRLIRKKFACMRTTKEWKLKIRVWDGSDPI